MKKKIQKQAKIEPLQTYNSEQKANNESKVLLIGTEKSGKTTLMNRIFKTSAGPSKRNKDSSNCQSKEISTNFAGQVNKLRITVQKVPGPMTQMNCDELNKNFGGIIIVYDHPCKKSLANIQKWLDKNLHMLRQNVIVIGNKLPTKKQ